MPSLSRCRRGRDAQRARRANGCDAFRMRPPWPHGLHGAHRPRSEACVAVWMWTWVVDVAWPWPNCCALTRSFACRSARHASKVRRIVRYPTSSSSASLQGHIHSMIASHFGSTSENGMQSTGPQTLFANSARTRRALNQFVESNTAGQSIAMGNSSSTFRE